MRHFPCYALAALLFLCQPARATTVPLSDLLQKGATIQSGDLLFYDFHSYASSGRGGAAGVDQSNLFVTSYFNVQDQEYGIEFASTGFRVGPGQSQDTRFSFFVRSLDSGTLLNGNTLTMEGTAPGTGYTAVIEDVLTADRTRLVAQKLVFISGNTESLYSHRDFSEDLSAALITKDILLSGNGNSAQVDSFTQSFSTVPEPLTASATVLGLLALAGYIRRAYGRRPAPLAHERQG